MALQYINRSGASLAGRLSLIKQHDGSLLPQLATALTSLSSTASFAEGTVTSSSSTLRNTGSNRAAYDQQRHLFSIPGFTDNGVEATKYHEKKLFGYAPHQVFDVVAAVDHYYKFVPWCQSSTVLLRKDNGNYIEAELEVGFQIFTEKYTSKVKLNSPSTITSQVGDTVLFSYLNNRWGFEQGPQPNTTWVTFEVDFAFKSPLYSQVATLFFEEVVRRMVGAFDGRCRELYGPSSVGKSASSVAS